jgi:hypothetical protein
MRWCGEEYGSELMTSEVNAVHESGERTFKTEKEYVCCRCEPLEACSGGGGGYLGGMFREGGLSSNFRGKKGNFVSDMDVDLLGVMLDFDDPGTCELRAVGDEVPATNLDENLNLHLGGENL